MLLNTCALHMRYHSYTGLLHCVCLLLAECRVPAEAETDAMNSVKARLGKSVQIQTLLRAFEARDRNLQESNSQRVNLWSITNLLVMVLVSGVQVYLLRSLFEDKRKSRT
ncbi:Transmembrane emp24 domain-containing protein 5 [Acipenser ruthenus]|uniref:Transmembrane emp24 domain-containing protein 5 n=1 Tax=Acipenser ruthenus TaxID=7906 RepID=A0A444UT72_ACIRT|nr:Transmembrane emp24 domain-containing protein 5 [Acipenser ruthenus]